MNGYKYREPYTVRIESGNPDVVKSESGTMVKEEPMTDEAFRQIDFGAKVVSFSYANEPIAEKGGQTDAV
jgi:hypothetical protein